MSTQTTQLKVTLPNPLLAFVQSKAGKFGISTSLYIKHLIIDDVKDMDVPVFPMSDATEKAGLAAIDQHRKGKTIQVDDIDAFFSSL